VGRECGSCCRRPCNWRSRCARGCSGSGSFEEQTEFDAILTEIGPNKINVIKVVRELTGLGLKEAKAVVDEAPKPIKEAVSKEEAQKIADKMAEVGAKVTIK